jgi:ATP-dependent DNA helicase RecG
VLTLKQKQTIEKYIGEFTQDKAALTIYPFRYEFRELWDENSYDSTKTFVLQGTIISAIKTLRFSRRSIVRFKVLTKDNELNCVIYNRPYFKNTYGDNKITITGSFNDKRDFVVSTINQKTIDDSIGYFAVYPLKKGVNQHQMRTIMKKVLTKQIDTIHEMIPTFLVNKYKLFDTKTALQEIHLPSSSENLSDALRTLKYAEALRYQMALELSRLEDLMRPKSIKDFSQFNLEEEIKSLPFKLTKDQLAVSLEILQDLKDSSLMRRLLLGDVGSGKTVVAMLMTKAMLKAQHQVAFLAPTEVLATQHAQSFKEFGLEVDLLTSTTKASDLLRRIQTGDAKIIIGTHALFSKDVSYNKLGFVIIDEQHRFGVAQRQSLIEKGAAVDVLMMSATPIPRTLASTLYSHLSISMIETLPQGRKPITTKLIKRNSIIDILDDVLDFVLKEKQQVYVICPAIDDDETRNVIEVTKNLKNELGDKLRIGSIHSKLKNETINREISKFKNHQLDVLVSTTIVEVGVHVDNANMMIIYDADRFGLSQLHQLRGRIGRKDQAGFCFVLTNSRNQDSLNRLHIFVNERDGFKLSELDLKLRGTGDLLGQRQSGFPHFSHLDLANDLKILELAKADAKNLVDNPEKEATIFVENIRKSQQRLLIQASI